MMKCQSLAEIVSDKLFKVCTKIATVKLTIKVSSIDLDADSCSPRAEDELPEDNRYFISQRSGYSDSSKILLSEL